MVLESSLKTKTLEYMLLRAQVEQFLYMEAELLEQRRLEAWFNLFTEDGVNHIPPLTDPSADPANSTFIMCDDSQRLNSRIKQILSGMTISENPPSKFCRLITNVRPEQVDEDTVRVLCNFHVQRSRRGKIDNFLGEYRYKLIKNNDTFFIAERVAILAQDVINQGHMSFIL